MKYLFKYVHKGSDRVKTLIESARTTTDNVERLPFHLQKQNTIIFEESRIVESILSRPDIEKNRIYEMVWNGRDKEWTKRQKGHTIGRIYFAHPTSGECFYMCMRSKLSKGALPSTTSKESMKLIIQLL
ncbi:hypothetical protein H5410_022138 [Solanum commersonii]|uniref:Uncharacterized protein n=1 Tax=Solanum commersonii TaxID=4109 RepID=A0A9J5ZDC6_SOLCO|nr:hypothetical protein H5410_022138 [Solanum commersonii]